MYAARADNNQSDIVKQLRRVPGISVLVIHTLKNCCDIIVGYKGKNYMFEIKSTNKAKLTEGESKFQGIWAGQVNVVCKVEEILIILGILIK